jgi:putative lipoic acid-binding regulatory protein
VAELITGSGAGVGGQEPPKIEFPCEYPVKVLGRNVSEFQPTVMEIFERHAPGFDQETIVLRDSRKGTFQSMTITIVATGPDQLDSLHKDLVATGLVQMVL